MANWGNGEKVERQEAVVKIQRFVGKSLQSLASDCGVAIVTPSGTVNKGWAGHTLELAIGLSKNSDQAPDGGSWELKTVPFKKRGEVWVPKETMAITMINPYEVSSTPFERSHLLAKLESLIVVKRSVGSTLHEPSYILDARGVDLVGDAYEQVKADYEEVQSVLLDPARGFSYLTGSMGRLVQPRTKGAGHGSTSRAFYARPAFVSSFFD